jgi:hypothetical protein
VDGGELCRHVQQCRIDGDGREPWHVVAGAEVVGLEVGHQQPGVRRQLPGSHLAPERSRDLDRASCETVSPVSARTGS